jgi:hypothetical protein
METYIEKSRELMESLNVKTKVIMSEARKGTCNDYSERKYRQVPGSAGHLVKGDDIV